MKKEYVNIEVTNDGGETWRPDKCLATSQVGHQLTGGGRTIIHQICASYRLAQP